MDIELINDFLRRLAANNTRDWFNAHKADYQAARSALEAAIVQAISRIASFDESIAHLQPKDTTYRINRDTRFSSDKSPYKTHFGIFINAHGKKSLRGGYYLHIEPGACLLAGGNYWLPTHILTSCRNEIMANEEEWLRCVESPAFLKYYGAPEDTTWESPQGFGMAKLKTCPAGFPRDYQYVKYLRLKDYCCWHRVGDNFFRGDAWLDQMEDMFRTAKPMMDFTNAVIDDYE